MQVIERVQFNLSCVDGYQPSGHFVQACSQIVVDHVFDICLAVCASQCESVLRSLPLRKKFIVCDLFRNIRTLLSWLLVRSLCSMSDVQIVSYPTAPMLPLSTLASCHWVHAIAEVRRHLLPSLLLPPLLVARSFSCPLDRLSDGYARGITTSHAFSQGHVRRSFLEASQCLSLSHGVHVSMYVRMYVCMYVLHVCMYV